VGARFFTFNLASGEVRTVLGCNENSQQQNRTYVAVAFYFVGAEDIAVT